MHFCLFLDWHWANTVWNLTQTMNCHFGLPYLPHGSEEELLFLREKCHSLLLALGGKDQNYHLNTQNPIWWSHPHPGLSLFFSYSGEGCFSPVTLPASSSSLCHRRPDSNSITQTGHRDSSGRWGLASGSFSQVILTFLAVGTALGKMKGDVPATPDEKVVTTKNQLNDKKYMESKAHKLWNTGHYHLYYVRT